MSQAHAIEQSYFATSHTSNPPKFDKVRIGGHSIPYSSVSGDSLSIKIRKEAIKREAIKREDEISKLINALQIEHEYEDWDGYGANPINRHSLKYAEAFLRNLELPVPLPFIGCEPSGRVGVEWIGEKMRLSVGFNDDGGIIYAGINAEERVFNGRNKNELDKRIADFMCL